LPDITQISVISGIACTGVVLTITVIRQKRLELSDLGSFIVTFFSGSNIPAAVFLFLYVFNPDPLLSQTKLKGYEKYISASGLVFFLATIITLWKLCKTAWETTPAKSGLNKDSFS